MKEVKDIKYLIEKVEEREHSVHRSVAWMSIIPAVGAIIFLWFAVSEIKSADKQLELKINDLDSIKIELEVYNQQIDSLRTEINTSRKRYDKLSELFRYYEWDPDPINYDSTSLEEATKAHEEILRILDGDQKLDHDVAIRYYAKKVDNERVKKAIFTMGYREILSPSNSWFAPTPSNRICFDKDVELKDVKVIALSLMREGVRVKRITLYPEGVLHKRSKPNSIEIFGDENLIDSSYLSFEQIIALEMDSLNYR